MEKKVYIKSYGCQMNVYDSERMEESLEFVGYKKSLQYDGSDLIILNTCHIRHNPTESVYSELGRIKLYKEECSKNGKKVVIVVAGCVAQAEGEEVIKRAPFVDIVVGTESYHNLPAMLKDIEAGSAKKIVELEFDTIEKFDQLPIDRKFRGPSAFVSIQEGCDKFCTFCVVPYTRGAEFSRPVGKILDEIKSLVDKGVKEITLLGQNVNAYHGVGLDGRESNLAELCEKISAISEIHRIRYTTSHPINFDLSLIEAHRSLPKLMPYVHLPVQSGSSKILKLMNRKHDRDFYLKVIESLRSARPDIAFSSDFIVGFPGETDQDFEDTMDLVRSVSYSQCYSFKYSNRPGTPADNMTDQVDEVVKDERLQRLQKLLQGQFESFNKSFLGKELDVLVEFEGKRSEYHQVNGKSPYLQAVAINIPKSKSIKDFYGQIIKVKISEVRANSLVANIA